MARKAIISYADIGLNDLELTVTKKHWVGDDGDKFDAPSAVKPPADPVVRIMSPAYVFDMDGDGAAIGAARDKADGDMERELLKLLIKMRNAVEELIDSETRALMDQLYGPEGASE